MAAATKPAAGAQEASAGISLAQYAAVRAAVAEGFPLADVLAVEGLTPRTFARADLAWKQRLAAEPELLAAYEQELAQAEDWLDRQVEPLAEDAAAWASFLAVFAAHPAPFDLLQEKDLGMNDVARLRRRWVRRVDEDAKVGELLKDLHARPGELGSLRVGPRVLQPSRVAEARGSGKAPAEEHAAAVPLGEPGLGLAEYAALCAELDALPEQRERVLRRHDLADEEMRAALDRRWQAALERDAALAKDFERLQAHHARRLEMLLARAREVDGAERSPASVAAPSAPAALSSGAIAGPRASIVSPAALQGTGPLLDVPRGAVVPFVPMHAELATVTAEPKPPRAAESLTGTAPLPDIPRGPELPFPRSSAAKVVKRPPPAIADTAPLSDIPRGPALPFTAGASGTPVPSTPTARPQQPRAPREVAETSPLQTPPRGPVIPFEATDPARRAEALAASTPAPQAAADLRETSLHLAIPRELLTQTASSPASVTGAASQTFKASPPSTPLSTAGDASTAPLHEAPDMILPLTQYAALCAELALSPATAEEIFRRYGLGSGEMRSAVDAAWKERLRGDPAEYSRWQDIYQHYYAHFARRGTPPR
ncbi:hypothetical protein WME75_01895 [Sorangium sp. So ce1014]|uniref:hypothetical protein n=1 Tax=Sorangium sp. So ce1014 TaxID=3133326 RepID=UPI003F630104